MEKQKLPLTIAAGILLAAVILFSGFLFRNPRQPEATQTGQIYLCGELHSQDDILEKELELWQQYYHENGMRHLFVEKPYYTAQFLNLWMESEDDQILNQVYEAWNGTQAHSPNVKAFYQEIKKTCPETVFHGTDVGHQRNTIGQEYLKYLEENGQKDSEQYQLAQQNIEQGETFYAEQDDVYRENCMAENFMAEYDRLTQEEGPTDIMGIYGAAHTDPESMNVTGEVPSMAGQIKARYGKRVHPKDLREEIEPVKTETMELIGKEYTALYFGKVDTSTSSGVRCVEIWQLENAYEDFKDCPTGDRFFTDNNFLTPLKEGQVFVLDFTTTTGEVIRQYYRTDGNTYEGSLCANEFLLEE